MKGLHRSRKGKLIAGVCSGMAEAFGWNVTLVRGLFIVGSFVPIVPGFLVYAVLWLIIPREE